MEIKNTVISTQKLLDEANKLLWDKNQKYYNDVLDFMNNRYLLLIWTFHTFD